MSVVSETFQSEPNYTDQDSTDDRDCGCDGSDSFSVSVGSSIWHPPCRQAAKQEEKSKVGGKDSSFCTVKRDELRVSKKRPS